MAALSDGLAVNNKGKGVAASSLGHVGRELAWVIVGQLVAFAGAAVGVRVLTGRMSPSAYGELALVMTMATMSQQVIFGPLCNAVVRFYAPSEESATLPVYFAAVGWVYKRVVGILIALAVVGSLAANWLRPGLAVAVACATVFALVSGCNSGLDSVQFAARQRAVVAGHQAVGQWLRFACAIVALSILSATESAVIVGYMVAAVVILSSQSVFFRRGFGKNISRRFVFDDDVRVLRSRMWAYAWPFAVWAPFTWLQLSADRWALQYYSDAASVGLYQAMYQVGYYPMALLSGFLLQLITPILFARAGAGSKGASVRAARKLNNWIVLVILGLTALAVVAAFAFHERICGILLAPAFRSKSWLLPWFVLSGGMFGAGQVLSLNPLMEMGSGSLLYPKVGTAVIGAAATVVFTRAAGLYGTTIATSLFPLAYLVWLLLVDRRNAARASTSSGAS